MFTFSNSSFSHPCDTRVFLFVKETLQPFNYNWTKKIHMLINLGILNNVYEIKDKSEAVQTFQALRHVKSF